MKRILIAALAGLSLISQAQAAEHHFVRGTCHITTLNESGTVVKEEHLSLTPVDPFNHYGLALAGHSEPFSVKVQLIVGRYDHIGALDSDRVSLEIDTNVSSAHQELAGREFAEGTKIEGGLEISQKQIACTIQKI